MNQGIKFVVVPSGATGGTFGFDWSPDFTYIGTDSAVTWRILRIM